MTVSTGVTSQPCLITDGMTNVNIIPNENVVNSNDVSIGDQIRLIESSTGYTPISEDDTITIKLTNDNSQIFIREIIIEADNFQSALLYIKTTSNTATWTFFAELTTSTTSFDNLYATELQLRFSVDTLSIKLGITGCFPSPVSTTTIVTTECTITRADYTRELERAPPSNDFVGYLINSTTTTATNTSIFIDDTIDRDTYVFIDNCTRLTCTRNGVRKVKVPCSDNCKYNPWSEWSKCNATCGEMGSRIRRKSLINMPPSNPLCQREIIETMPCAGDPCSCVRGVNCTCDLTDWSQWTTCSLPCGNGQQERTRQRKTNETENCPSTNLRQVRPCNVDCCSVDGKFTSWTDWTACSKTCGSGIQRRNRSCTAPLPSCKGKPCEGPPEETRVCNSNPCQQNCENGQVYSECANDCDTSCDSLTCDNQCQKPDKCMPGCVCPGNKIIGRNGQCVDRKECQCRLPADNSTLVNGESNVRDPCTTYTCRDGCIVKKDNNCTLCRWSQWTRFSDCSDSCNGTQSRYRTYDGPNCPDKRTEEDTKACSSNCTTVCSVTAENGTVVTYNVGDLIEQTRCSRTVCRETGLAETQPIPGTAVNGQWNLWSDWTNCSQTCNGTRTRYRLCASPAPECNGEICKKLPSTQVDFVTVGDNANVLQETERDRCNLLCTTTAQTTTPYSTIVTTPHEECYLRNGSSTVVVPPQTTVPNPENRCEICRCKDGTATCTTICSENEQTCLSKQAQDPSNRYTWIPAKSGECCGTCNKTKVESKCRVEILRDEFVTAGQCRSLTPVGREQCAGGCESQASNVLIMPQGTYQLGNSTCECCQPDTTTTQEISMSCETIGVPAFIVRAKYLRIQSCKCQVCNG